jgi:hypothetical protein
VKTGLREGYHFTSFLNWRMIEEQGLLPQPIGGKLNEILEGRSGNWVYIHELQGRALVGTLLYIAARHITDQIVLLGVSYSDEDLVWGENQNLMVMHDMPDGGPNHQYWLAGEMAAILFKRIPPKQIRMIRLYDLQEMVK